MDIRSALLEEIETYLRATGMSPYKFGKEAVNDTKFVWWLRKGRGFYPKTHDRIIEFIRSNPPAAGNRAA